MNPFFSIILPTHNRASLIKKAIESVLNQKFQSWELIIVDDGSTDNTKEVVSTFHDSRIIYCYQNNSERSVARNNGVSRARGKYICFLDSDDYYLNNHLENIYLSVELGEFPKALFMVDVIREENGRLKNVEHEKLENHINNICYILCSKETVIPARVAIHSEILKEYHFNPKLNVSEDAELFVRIATKYPFIQVPYNSVVYHLHNYNTTNKANNPFAGQLVALKMIFSNPVLKPFIPLKIKMRKLSTCYYGIAQYYLYKEQYAKMIWTLIKSLLLDPFSNNSKAKLYLILNHLPEVFK